MIKRTKINAVILAMFFAGAMLPACGKEKSKESEQKAMAKIPEHASHDALKAQLQKYAHVHIGFDAALLSKPETEALGKLVRAAHVMDEIFLRQVWMGNVGLRGTLEAAIAEAKKTPAADARTTAAALEDLYHFYQINFGPWDRIDEDRPFIGTMKKPAGAAFYPEDMTKEEFENFLTQNADQKEAFQGYFTVIRRINGQLTAVPYSTEYKAQLEEAAVLLHDAAEVLSDPLNKKDYREGVDYTSLAKYLHSRADAFSSNDYLVSDTDWMDVKNNIIDVTIGPYEVYEDALLGYKAAFEAFIAIRQPEESKKLEGLKRYLQALENNLPIPQEHKNPKRGTESPISVVDLVYTGGDTKAGVQTIAFNLPNDERVREAKGSKKVLLKNISKAKYDKILVPIAGKLLDPDQMQHLSFDAYFNNVLQHEMAHGLGPGNIKLKSGETSTVSRELKELYSPIEEAKADVLGLYNTAYLEREKFLPEGSAVKGYVSFLPGFFRAIRFGTTSAHGKANLVEFNFLSEQGAITLDTKKDKFRVNVDRMPAAVRTLANQLLMIQANGDYEAARLFLDKYGKTSAEVERLLAKLKDVPVDIEPHYDAERFLMPGTALSSSHR